MGWDTQASLLGMGVSAHAFWCHETFTGLDIPVISGVHILGLSGLPRSTPGQTRVLGGGQLGLDMQASLLGMGVAAHAFWCHETFTGLDIPVFSGVHILGLSGLPLSTPNAKRAF